MCRLALYWGPPILISEFILKPSRSIIKQSYDARERLSDHSLPFHVGYGNLNGDGFGIGWYSACGSQQDTRPCTFTSVTPAWNNDNLNRLASKLESGLIFAHVRAAYPGMPVSEQNCHPFAHGDYIFMHNGVIAGFLEIRRKLLGELSDAAYNTVQSFHSDSAVSFALFLHHLPNMTERHSAEVLLRAMQATIATISRIQNEEGITDTSLLNFVVSDGESTIATRFVSKEDAPAASLYFAEGSAYERGKPVAALAARNATFRASVQAGGGDAGAVGTRSAAITGEADYHLNYSGNGARVCLIASEPVTATASDWVEVPKNTALVICKEKDGLLTVVRAPLTTSGFHPRHEEIYKCLDSVTGAAGIQGAARRSYLRLAATHDITRKHAQRAEIDDGWETPRREVRSNSLCTSRSFGDISDTGSANGDDQGSDEHLLTGHKLPVITLTTEDDVLFSGSTDATIKVWCLKDCKYLRTLHGHRDPIRCLTVAGGALVSAGAKTVRVWDLSDLSCVAVLAASDIRGSLKALAVAQDGTIYVGGQDCQVKLYPAEYACNMDADSPRAMKDCETARICTGTAIEPALATDAANGHCASVTCLALCGDYICSGSSDSTVRVWRAKTLEFVKVLRGHRGSVLALHAVPGLLLSGGRDHLVRAWDPDTWVCRRTLGGHTDDIVSITSLEVTSSSPAGLTSKLSSTISFNARPSAAARSPSLSGRQLVSLLSMYDRPARAGNKTTVFATASADGTVKLWGVKELACLRTFSTKSSGPGPVPVMSSALTARFVTAGLINGNIVLYPAEDAYEAAIQEGQEQGGKGIGGTSPTAALAATKKGPLGVDHNGHALVPIEESPQDATNTAHRLALEFERALRIFIRIKSVSADPDLSQDCFRGAKFLLRLLESMGAEVKLAQPVEGKNPVVLGRIGTDPNLPTVTCYGHYDVQPAMEPEWTGNPFEISAVDGYLIARGVSDNKGPVLAFIYAVKELLEERGGVTGTGGGLPCNVVFLIEGEEENGSIGFKDAVQQNLRWFEGTKAVFISNTLWVGENRPCITYGMRGMITLSIEVRGASKDLHSGNEGGVFSEPLADLNKILASLIDSRCNVSVPGFYNRVRPNMLEAALQRMKDSSEFSLEGYRKALGVKELAAGRSERELLTARWCQPTLSVVDVRVGTAEDADTAHYRFGPTRFSVIPRAAVGKVSIRFVPDQDANEIIECLTTHLQHEFAKLRSGNSLSVKVHSVGDWWEANPGSELMQITEGAVEAEWGEKPLLVREGGTMPVASALEKMLDAPALLLPMGQSSDCCHLANERIRKENLIRGKNVIKRLLTAIGGKTK